VLQLVLKLAFPPGTKQQQQQHLVIMTNEYGAIPQQDAQQEDAVAKTPVAVASCVIDLDDSANTIDVPAEARDLTWTDTYYADNKVEGVIAVFDIDYESIRRAMYHRLIIIVPIIVLFFVLYGIFIFSLDQVGDAYTDGPSNNSSVYIWLAYSLFITFLLVKSVKKMSKNVIGLHLAVTKEGIRKDMHRFPLGNMFRTTTIVSTRVHVIHSTFQTRRILFRPRKDAVIIGFTTFFSETPISHFLHSLFCFILT
jgi:hypothetical protein